MKGFRAKKPGTHLNLVKFSGQHDGVRRFVRHDLDPGDEICWNSGLSRAIPYIATLPTSLIDSLRVMVTLYRPMIASMDLCFWITLPLLVDGCSESSAANLDVWTE